MTELIRSEAPSESVTALMIIYVLTFFELFFAVLVVLGLLQGHDPRWLSFWIGAMFFGLAAMVDIYRKHFQSDEMVAKTRLPKVVPRRELKD